MVTAKINRILVSVGLIFSVLVAAVPFSLFTNSAQVSAAATVQYNKIDDLEARAKFNAYYYLMQQCFDKAPIETNAGKVAAGQLFYDQFTGLSSSANIQLINFVAGGSGFGTDGKSTCGATSSEFSKLALQAFGLTSLDLVCTMGYSRNIQGSGSGCTSGTNDFDPGGGATVSTARKDKFSAAIASLTGWTAAEAIADGSSYTYDRFTLINACTTGVKVATLNGVPANMQYDIPNVAADGTNSTDLFIGTADRNYEWPVDDYGYKRKCGEILNNLKTDFLNEFTVYKQVLFKKALTQTCINNNYKDIPGGSFPSVSTLSACISGGLNKTTLNYCRDNWKDTTYQGSPISREPERAACLYGQTTNVSLTPSTTPSNNLAGAPTTSCAIDGIGWIVCGIMRALASFNDAMYGVVEKILITQPLETTSGGVQTPQYIVWQTIRNIANVLLVVVFLIIIFSQATSIGISSYGIKKMMPRLIIAAIAINVSYFAMQLAVDLANLIGIGLHNFLDGVATSAFNAAQVSMEKVISDILTGAVAVATTATILSFTSFTAGALGLIALPFLAVAVLSVLAAFVTLFLRNVLIIVLAIISPLAFAAYLLPNTSDLFTKWRKLLTSMLILFPTAALLFAGAKIAGYTIIGNGSGTMETFFGYVVMMLPLFMLPWLARQGGGILKTVGDRLQGAAKLAKKPLQDVLKPAVDRERAARDIGRAGFFGRRRQLDADGYALNRDGTRRRQTLRQRIVNQRQDVEQTAKNDQDRKGKNWEQRAIDNPNGRTGAIITDKEQLHLRGNAQAEELKAHEAHRIADPASFDKLYSNRIADAKTETKPLQEEERRDQARRVLRNEASTLGGGNLGDLSKAGFTAAKRADAAEGELTIRNRQNNAAADAAIQSIKLSEAQGKQKDSDEQKAYDNNKARLGTDEQIAEQGTVFNVNESARANAESKALVDAAADVDAGQMASRDAQKAAEKTSEEFTEKQRSEQEARLVPGGDLADVQGRIEGYKADTEVATTDQLAELNRRKNLGGDLQNQAFAAETNKKVAESRAAGLRSIIDRGATQSKDKELNFLGKNRAKLQQAADTKGSYDVASSGAASLTAARLAAARSGNPDLIIPGYSAANRSRAQSGARQETIGSSASSKAKGDEELYRAAEIQREPDGDLARAMAAVVNSGPEGVVGGISTSTNRVVGAANQAILKDEQGDEGVTDEEFTQNGMGVKEALAVAGIDRESGKYLRDITDDAEIAELFPQFTEMDDTEKAEFRADLKAGGVVRDSNKKIIRTRADDTDVTTAIRRVTRSGDKGANDLLLDRILEIGNLAEEARAVATEDPTPENLKKAKDLQKQAQRFQSAAISEWSKNPGAMPPIVSSEDRDAMARGQLTGSRENLSLAVFLKGKFTPGNATRYDKDHFKSMAKTLSKMTPDQIRAGIDSFTEGYSPADKAAMEKSFAQAFMTLDTLQGDPQYANNLEDSASAAIDKIRGTFEELYDDGVLTRPEGYYRPMWRGAGELLLDENNKPVPYGGTAPGPTTATGSAPAPTSADYTAASSDDLIIPRS